MAYVSHFYIGLDLDAKPVHLSEISNLKDPLFFYDDIMATIESRFESLPNKDGRKPDFVYSSRWIASVIGSRYAYSLIFDL